LLPQEKKCRGGNPAAKWRSVEEEEMGRASHNNHPFLDLLPQPYTHLPFLLQQRSRTKPENPWTKKFY
jgi:hypothetical protein